MIEYTGTGAHIHNVGLAQASKPLTTANHYFEIEIVEPGQHCYIAIGLVHKVTLFTDFTIQCFLKQRSK